MGAGCGISVREMAVIIDLKHGMLWLYRTRASLRHEERAVVKKMLGGIERGWEVGLRQFESKGVRSRG